MLSVNNYGGLWAIDYISNSLGCTLYVSHDENEVWNEYDRFSEMSDRQLEAYLMTI